jgi:hypothetical protein
MNDRSLISHPQFNVFDPGVYPQFSNYFPQRRQLGEDDSSKFARPRVEQLEKIESEKGLKTVIDKANPQWLEKARARCWQSRNRRSLMQILHLKCNSGIGKRGMTLNL